MVSEPVLPRTSPLFLYRLVIYGVLLLAEGDTDTIAGIRYTNSIKGDNLCPPQIIPFTICFGAF